MCLYSTCAYRHIHTWQMFFGVLAAVTAPSSIKFESNCTFSDMQWSLCHIQYEPIPFCTKLLGKDSVAYNWKHLCQNFSKIHHPQWTKRKSFLSHKRHQKEIKYPSHHNSVIRSYYITQEAKEQHDIWNHVRSGGIQSCLWIFLKQETFLIHPRYFCTPSLSPQLGTATTITVPRGGIWKAGAHGGLRPVTFCHRYPQAALPVPPPPALPGMTGWMQAGAEEVSPSSIWQKNKAKITYLQGQSQHKREENQA